MVSVSAKWAKYVTDMLTMPFFSYLLKLTIEERVSWVQFVTYLHNFIV